MKHSNEQKIKKNQERITRNICNKVTMSFSMGMIKTVADVYRVSGLSSSDLTTSELSVVVTKEWLDKWKSELTQTNEVARPKVERSTEPEESLTATRQTEQRQEALTTPPLQTTTNNDEKEQQNLALPDTLKNLTFKQRELLTETESEERSTKDYGFVPSPNEKFTAFWAQKKAIVEILDKFMKEKRGCVLLRARGGSGKTFVAGAIDRRFKDSGFLLGKTFGITETLHITKTPIVDQTIEVMESVFNIKNFKGTDVIGVDGLRTRAGSLWIEKREIVRDGEMEVEYNWRPYLSPAFVIADESQMYKNPSSSRGKQIIAYTKLPSSLILFMSATPFARVADARYFAIATKRNIEHLGFPKGTVINEATWPTYAQIMCGDGFVPEDYNEAALSRLMEDLKDYIVEMEGMRWQFDNKPSVEVITPTNEELGNINKAIEEYERKKKLLNESITDDNRVRAMIELQQLLSKCEYEKRFRYAAKMDADVKRGKAPILAVKSKRCLIAVVKILINNYGWTRDDISLIWGGGNTMLTGKQKMKIKLIEQQKLLAEKGINIDITSEFNLDEIADPIVEEIPKGLRLETQNKKERDVERIRFQSGRTKGCIITYSSGGTGLSLHHTDQYTNYKVKRKKSGYAVEDDIKNCPTKPRTLTLGTVWSPYDLVQTYYRGARINSLSDTEVTFMCYRNTPEQYQADVLTHKLKCLNRASVLKESWTGIIDNYVNAKAEASKLIDATRDVEAKDFVSSADVDVSEVDEDEDDE